MKIYINNFNIEILPIILKLLSDKYINSETFIQVYSIDGIYIINETKLEKLNSIDLDIIIKKNYYNDFTLIVDPSYYVKENVYNIGAEHITTRMKRCFFALEKNSKIKLIIEGEFSKDIKNDYDIIPSDIYFEMPDNFDINDALVKKEIIVFLSLLN